MNRRLCVLALILGAVGCAQSKGPRTFDLDLPQNWSKAGTLVLAFDSLEVPAAQGVVFRMFPARDGRGNSLGSVSVLAKSREDKGTQRIDRIEMNLGREFRRWAEEQHSGRISITLKPYSGLREAPDFVWQVKQVRLEAR
jgi:hypothetical protein